METQNRSPGGSLSRAQSARLRCHSFGIRRREKRGSDAVEDVGGM